MKRVTCGCVLRAAGWIGQHARTLKNIHLFMWQLLPPLLPPKENYFIEWEMLMYFLFHFHTCICCRRVGFRDDKKTFNMQTLKVLTPMPYLWVGGDGGGIHYTKVNVNSFFAARNKIRERTHFVSRKESKNGFGSVGGAQNLRTRRIYSYNVTNKSEIVFRLLVWMMLFDALRMK